MLFLRRKEGQAVFIGRAITLNTMKSAYDIKIKVLSPKTDKDTVRLWIDDRLSGHAYEKELSVEESVYISGVIVKYTGVVPFFDLSNKLQYQLAFQCGREFTILRDNTKSEAPSTHKVRKTNLLRRRKRDAGDDYDTRSTGTEIQQ